MGENEPGEAEGVAGKRPTRWPGWARPAPEEAPGTETGRGVGDGNDGGGEGQRSSMSFTSWEKLSFLLLCVCFFVFVFMVYGGVRAEEALGSTRNMW